MVDHDRLEVQGSAGASKMGLRSLATSTLVLTIEEMNRFTTEVPRGTLALKR